MTLEEIAVDKQSHVGWKEYAVVAVSTEGPAIIGANAGLFGLEAITGSTAAMTGGFLTGDYVFGTIGQIASYWGLNKEKFRDDNGLFLYKRFAKDIGKVLLYDVPACAVAYPVGGYMTYELLERDWDTAVVGVLAGVTTSIVWNTANYFIYSTIKKDSDEKVAMNMIQKATNWIRSFRGTA